MKKNLTKLFGFLFFVVFSEIFLQKYDFGEKPHFFPHYGKEKDEKQGIHLQHLLVFLKILGSIPCSLKINNSR